MQISSYNDFNHSCLKGLIQPFLANYSASQRFYANYKSNLAQFNRFNPFNHTQNSLKHEILPFTLKL